MKKKQVAARTPRDGGAKKDATTSAAKRKTRPRNLKIRLLSDHISTKNQTKSGPKLAILRSKSDWFPKPNSDIRRINFYWKIFHI